MSNAAVPGDVFVPPELWLAPERRGLQTNSGKRFSMGAFTDWQERLRKQLEASLHRSSRVVVEGQWMFDPAIVTLSGDAASVFVAVTRALEYDRPELTGQRLELTYAATDDVEVAAREITKFIRAMH